MTARAPIVMKRYYTYNTSIVCQNIGTAADNNDPAVWWRCGIQCLC